MWPTLGGPGRELYLLAALATTAFVVRSSWQRLVIDAQGMTLHQVPGSRHVAWHEVRHIEVDWRRLGEGARLGRATQPKVTCRDGRRIRSAVRRGLVHEARDDERRAVHRELAHHADRHGVALDVHPPASDQG